MRILSGGDNFVRHVTSVVLARCAEHSGMSASRSSSDLQVSRRDPVIAEGGSSLLGNLIEAISKCQLLQPLADSLWIVCSRHTYPLLASNSLLTQVADSHFISVQDDLQDLPGCANAFQQSSACGQLDDQASLLFIDTSSYCTWTNSLQRFVTHSLLQNEICAARTQMKYWTGPTTARAALILEDGSYNAQVRDVQPGTRPLPRSAQEQLLCPLLCVPAQRRLSFFKAANQSHDILQMMQLLLQAAAVHSLPVDGCLWVSGPEGLQLLQAYRSMTQINRMSRSAMPAKSVPVDVMKPSPEQAALESLSLSCLSSQALDLSAASRAPGKIVREPPAVQLAAQKHQPKRQHPVYLTSNNAYGSKAPSLHELPLSWHGIRGDFTRKQATGKVVTTGLKTAISNHVVADVLHEFGL